MLAVLHDNTIRSNSFLLHAIQIIYQGNIEMANNSDPNDGNNSDPNDGNAFADAVADFNTADDNADWGITPSSDASTQVDFDIDINPGGD